MRDLLERRVVERQASAGRAADPGRRLARTAPPPPVRGRRDRSRRRRGARARTRTRQTWGSARRLHGSPPAPAALRRRRPPPSCCRRGRRPRSTTRFGRRGRRGRARLGARRWRGRRRRRRGRRRCRWAAAAPAVASTGSFGTGAGSHRLLKWRRLVSRQTAKSMLRTSERAGSWVARFSQCCRGDGGGGEVEVVVGGGDASRRWSGAAAVTCRLARAICVQSHDTVQTETVCCTKSSAWSAKATTVSFSGRSKGEAHLGGGGA